LHASLRDEFSPNPLARNDMLSPFLRHLPSFCLLIGVTVPLVPVGPTSAKRLAAPPPEKEERKTDNGPDAAAVKENTVLIKKQLHTDMESLETLYKYFHANPELSLLEAKTASRMAKELRAAGVTVT